MSFNSSAGAIPLWQFYYIISAKNSIYQLRGSLFLCGIRRETSVPFAKSIVNPVIP